MKSSELGDVFGRNDFDNVEAKWKSVYCIDSQWSDYAMIVVVQDKNGYESIQNDEINNCITLILIYCRIGVCALHNGIKLIVHCTLLATALMQRNIMVYVCDAPTTTTSRQQSHLRNDKCTILLRQCIQSVLFRFLHNAQLLPFCLRPYYLVLLILLAY